jgi:hypothetical protein
MIVFAQRLESSDSMPLLRIVGKLGVTDHRTNSRRLRSLRTLRSQTTVKGWVGVVAGPLRGGSRSLSHVFSLSQSLVGSQGIARLVAHRECPRGGSR